MYKILSVSHDALVSQRQRLLLERGGYTVVSAVDAAEATPLIHGANIDAIFLGTAIGAVDRTSLALLGVSSGIPVVCTCGMVPDSGCPVVHVPPDEPAQLLAAFAEILGTSATSAVGA